MIPSEDLGFSLLRVLFPLLAVFVLVRIAFRLPFAFAVYRLPFPCVHRLQLPYAPTVSEKRAEVRHPSVQCRVSEFIRGSPNEYRQHTLHEKKEKKDDGVRLENRLF